MTDETFNLEFYVTDEEFAERSEAWSNWFSDRGDAEVSMSVGPSSYATQKRFVIFHFKKKEDATLFLMFNDGKVVP